MRKRNKKKKKKKDKSRGTKSLEHVDELERPRGLYVQTSAHARVNAFIGIMPDVNFLGSLRPIRRMVTYNAAWYHRNSAFDWSPTE